MRHCYGQVIEMLEAYEGIQIVKVSLTHNTEMVKAIYYHMGDQGCSLGDLVKLNTSALDLELGTGGFAFIIAVIDVNEEAIVSNEESDASSFSRKSLYPGHIMKLRYSPIQTPVLTSEAQESEHHPLFTETFHLNKKKIILGELHSMLPVISSLLHLWQPKHRLVYIMDDQACLYAPFSNVLRQLKEKLPLTVITYGQALGGDLEAVNLYTALETAIKVVDADHIMVMQGPGGVGTGTSRGFSGMQLCHWLHTTYGLGGEAVVIPRIQGADPRIRHFGLSHHTVEPLKMSFISTHIAYPSMFCNHEGEHIMLQALEERLHIQFNELREQHYVYPIQLEYFQDELKTALNWFGYPVKTMGKSYAEEPLFFWAIGAAFSLYKQKYD